MRNPFRSLFFQTRRGDRSGRSVEAGCDIHIYHVCRSNLLPDHNSQRSQGENGVLSRTGDDIDLCSTTRVYALRLFCRIFVGCGRQCAVLGFRHGFVTVSGSSLHFGRSVIVSNRDLPYPIAPVRGSCVTPFFSFCVEFYSGTPASDVSPNDSKQSLHQVSMVFADASVFCASSHVFHNITPQLAMGL